MRPSESRGADPYGFAPRFAHDSKSPRKRFRYWPLDMDIHNRRVTELREDVHARWARYLRSLPLRQLASTESAAAAERLWARLLEEIERLVPPNASPTDDSGILMSWTKDGQHLEIEVMSDATYEWFYRNRAQEIAEGGIEEDDNLRDQLIGRLRQVIA